MVCHGGAMAIQIPALFCWQGVLKKYPIVWLGGGKPVNTGVGKTMYIVSTRFLFFPLLFLLPTYPDLT